MCRHHWQHCSRSWYIYIVLYCTVLYTIVYQVIPVRTAETRGRIAGSMVALVAWGGPPNFSILLSNLWGVGSLTCFYTIRSENCVLPTPRTPHSALRTPALNQPQPQDDAVRAAVPAGDGGRVGATVHPSQCCCLQHRVHRHRRNEDAVSITVTVNYSDSVNHALLTSCMHPHAARG